MKKYENMNDRADEQPVKKRKFNLYNLLNPDKDGKEIPKESKNAPRDLKFFFKLAGRRFSTIITLNIMLILGNFPIIFFFLVLAGYFSKTAVSAQSVVFPTLYGAMQFGAEGASTAALFGVHGVLSTMRVLSVADYILLVVGAVLLLFTFGPVHCGITYILRNIVRGVPIFLWQDFWDTIKKNLRQAWIIGALDLTFLFLIVYDIIFFNAALNGFLSSVLFWAAIFIGIFYFFMRMYLYLLTITFDLKIFKIFKNALIFSLLGIKRNLLAALGILLCIGINYVMLMVYFPIGFILPFIITVGMILFIEVYAAWPKIKQIMVDPYYNEDGSEKEQAPA